MNDEKDDERVIIVDSDFSYLEARVIAHMLAECDGVLEDGTMVDIKISKQMICIGAHGQLPPILDGRRYMVLDEPHKIMKHGPPQGRHKKGRQTQWRNK